jgi:hypothetical protein
MTMRMTIAMKIWMSTGMNARGVHASVCADAIAYIELYRIRAVRFLIVFNHIKKQSKDSLCC